MFAKTFCKPGAFLSVVPLGLRTTLQYNANGLIERAYIGYDDDKTISADVLAIIKQHKLVPLSIPTKGGTTWVKGVFYTETEFFDEGVLPMCIESSMISDMKKNPDKYTFYSGNVESLAASFKGATTIRNWLSMSKFELLPAYVISANMDSNSFEKMVNTPRYPFKFPLISGYMIFENNTFRYFPLDLHQSVVSKVSRFNDENGYIKANMHTTAGDIIVQYSDIVRFNINAASSVVRKKSGEIIYSTCTDGKKRDKRTSKLTCSICGKQFVAPTVGPVCCDDDHCRSKMYPDICHFLKVLNLPEMSHERFNKLILSGDVLCLTDVLLLDEYKELEIVTSLDKLLESVVPLNVCPNASVFTMFTNRCNNSVQTLEYYMTNPSRLVTDLNISSIFVKRFVDWLSDGYNITTIETLLNSENIKLVDKIKKFEGAPIFRGKTIMITGKFLHGDMNEIMSIIQSYEARVVTQFTNDVDAVVVGQLKEEIDGGALQNARQNNIVIFEEMDFFERYEIDDDLRSNLL